MPTTTERRVLLVSPHKNGMEPNVLIDVQMEEFGTSDLKLVSAQPVNSGTVTLVLFAPTEKHGILTPKLANAQFHQPGTESPVLFVLEEDFITMLLTNANAQADKPTTDMSVP